MFKRLLILCLIIVSCSFVSCSRLLSLKERIDCLQYCIDEHCLRNVTIIVEDELGEPIERTLKIIDPNCGYKCIQGCKKSNDPIVKELNSKNKNIEQ